MKQKMEKEQYHAAKAHLVAGMGSASIGAKSRSLRRIADQPVECLPALACFSTAGPGGALRWMTWSPEQTAWSSTRLSRANSVGKLLTPLHPPSRWNCKSILTCMSVSARLTVCGRHSESATMASAPSREKNRQGKDADWVASLQRDSSEASTD